MKTITVITPANIEITYRLAGAGSRLAAFTIDFLIQTVFCLLVAAGVLFGLSGIRIHALEELGGFSLAFVILLFLAVYAGYFIVCELTMNGQSIGKKIFGLRVIRENGQPVGLTQSLIRNVFRIALDMLYIGLFVILFSKNHKRLGDMAAGTVVVSEHYESKSTPSLTVDFTPQNNNRIETAYPHITLTEEERRILDAFLERRKSLPENGAVIRSQINAYLARKWEIDARLLNDEVLKRIAAL